MSESKRLIQPNELFKMRFVQNAALSPDGKEVAYALAQYDEQSDSDKVALWLVNTVTNQTRQMTTGDYQDRNPAWSPDGRSIGFVSTRSGTPQIYILPVDGGEARQITRLEQGVREGPVWSPDGRTIAFTAGLPPDKMPDLTRPVPGHPDRLSLGWHGYGGCGGAEYLCCGS